jgi:predicted DCC family thiol-disulfide oxidoreductase YuxK
LQTITVASRIVYALRCCFDSIQDHSDIQRHTSIAVPRKRTVFGPDSSRRLMGDHYILFFDGVCGLCNRAVDFVLRADRNRIFLYAPLQGETFREAARAHPESANEDSIFLLRRGPGNETLLFRSDAVLCVLENLPGYRWLARIGRLAPRPVRDGAYRFIAATRYRIWGKRDSCRLPSPEERSRFLP